MVAAMQDPDEKAPRQSRSRRSELALLEATTAVLIEGGLDACHIPAVAARAGVSVGTVYRRFRDKDALLNATFRHRLACQADGEQALRQHLATCPTLAATVRAIVTAFIGALAASGQFTGALRHFAQQAGDPALQAEIRQGRRRLLMLMEEALLPHAPGTDPRTIRLALITLSATLQALLLNDDIALLGWQRDDQRMIDELTHITVAQIGVNTPP